MTKVFCPYCGDIMQNTYSVAYKKGKGAIMVCDDCKKYFVFCPLSDMEAKKILDKENRREKNAF